MRDEGRTVGRASAATSRWMGVGAAVVLSLVAVGCSADDGAGAAATRTAASSGSPSVPPTDSVTPTATATLPPTATTPPPATTPAPPVFDPAAALETVRVLAEGLGPREATSAAYARAADLVGQRFAELGYTVRRQELGVPAGVSWGVPVPAGTTVNVIAEPVGFDAARPHLVVGAHLDTVPQAPGAEDNASGVAVLLELARMSAAQPPVLPVVFVAFGAEEPRGEGDDLHHFGSQAYVAVLPEPARAGLRGMVALDRVGVGDVVPVCFGELGPVTLAEQLLAQGPVAGVPVSGICRNRTSDHWSFERGGLMGARIGSTPYAGYHSPQDVVSVVNPAQLDRSGRLVWALLQSLAA